MKGKELKSTSVGLLAGTLGATVSGGTALCVGACGAVCGTSVISMLGLSTGTLGVALAEWQPVFIGISVLAFGYSFYNLYFRQKNTTRSTDEACKCPPNGLPLRKQRLFLWLAFILSIGFYAYPAFTAQFTPDQEVIADPDTDFQRSGIPLENSKSCVPTSCDGGAKEVSCSGENSEKTSCSPQKTSSCEGG